MSPLACPVDGGLAGFVLDLGYADENGDDGSEAVRRTTRETRALVSRMRDLPADVS